MWRSESHSSVLAAKLAHRAPSDLEWALPSVECESCRRQQTKKTVKLFKNVVYRKKNHSSSSSSSRASISSTLKLHSTFTAPSLGEFTHNHSPSRSHHRRHHSRDNDMLSATPRAHKHLSSPTPGRSSRPQRPTIHGRTVSQGPYCVRRPSLADILADRALSPWTLASFREYCRQNMCLENLDFTIDAKHYQHTYNQIYTPQTDDASPADRADLLHLKALWKTLINMYIARHGLQEINLPATIRDNLLLIPDSQLPPPPEVLAPAVDQIHALMEDSILMSFLNDIRPDSDSAEQVEADFAARAFKARSMFVETSTIPADMLFPAPFAEPGEFADLGSGSTSFSSLPSARALRPKSSVITKHSHSSSTPSVSGDPGLTDDNVSFTTRATSDTTEMISPPHTPPTSQPATRTATATAVKSPSKSKSSHSASESFKRMGTKLGLRSGSSNSKKSGSSSSKNIFSSASATSSTSFF